MGLLDAVRELFAKLLAEEIGAAGGCDGIFLGLKND
jgi:hypothetical protein